MPWTADEFQRFTSPLTDTEIDLLYARFLSDTPGTRTDTVSFRRFMRIQESNHMPVHTWLDLIVRVGRFTKPDYDRLLLPTRAVELA
jgi:hypothetical protein